ncbi:MAG: hypothetical protein ABI123_07145, partial [Ginsengibacter sp.]
MKILLTAFFMLSTLCLQAQILKKIIDKTKQKTEEKVSEKISDRVSDAASKPIDDAGTKKKSKTREENAEEPEPSESSETTKVQVKNQVEKKSLSTYSKYDFVPGEKVLVYEDFSQDAVGDFPGKWNTNAGGEIVKIGGEEGQWLKVNKQGKFIPEFIINLPENFTLEFDLICNEGFSFYSTSFSTLLFTGSSSNEAFDYSFITNDKRSGVILKLHPHNASSDGGQARIITFENGGQIIDNELKTTQFNSENGKNKVRISIWRQKQRIRMYVNEDKVFDLPRALAVGKEYNLAMFELGNDMSLENDQYLFGNIKLAVGAPDTRNKLLT